MTPEQSIVEMLLRSSTLGRADDTGPAPEARALLAALFALQLAQRKVTADLQHQTGLSDSDLIALGVLADRPPSPVKDLSTALRLTAGSTSTLVDRLTRAGMVDRVQSTTDRRVALVSITPHGAQIMDSARDRYLFAIDRALESCTGDCLDTTTHVLHGIAGGLDEQAPAAPTHPIDALPAIKHIVDSIRLNPHRATTASRPSLTA